MPYVFQPLTGDLIFIPNSGGGSGDVVGPGSSTDNAVVRFDGATGTSIQNSVVTIDDSGNVVTPASVQADSFESDTTIHASGNISADGDVSADNINVSADVNSDHVETNTISATSGTITTIGSTTSNISGTANIGTIHSNSQTANRVATFDASSNLVSAATTTTELGFVTGVTSSIQTQLNSKIPSTEKGANNGVATLDGGGKIPLAQLPSSIFIYKGVWNAATNTPTLSDGTGVAGWLYRVGVAGTQDLGSGSIVFNVGDYVIYNDTGTWEKSDTTDAVVSVNGQTGIVVLDTDDISEGLTNKYYSEILFDASLATKTTADLAEGSNLYFTDERAQDAVGTILTDSSSIDLIYSDATPSISASVIPGGVDHNQLLNYVANKHVDHSGVNISTPSDSGLSGGGDITTSRTLSVDIPGTTLETNISNGDKILIFDVSASANRSMTRQNFLSGVSLDAPGDINESSFTIANNQSSSADISGFSFANAVVRGFTADVTVSIDATSDLYEKFELEAVQKGSTWEMSTSSEGDDSLVVFSITNAGQIQYQSANYSGFVDGIIHFRAHILSV